MLSCYVVQVLTDWFWDGFSCPCHHWYQFCSHILFLF